MTFSLEVLPILQHHGGLELERYSHVEVSSDELRDGAVWHGLRVRLDLEPADQHGNEQLDLHLQPSPSHDTHHILFAPYMPTSAATLTQQDAASVERAGAPGFLTQCSNEGAVTPNNYVVT